MCDPLVIGGISAASGALGAVGQYQSASEQAAAQNRAIANKANQRNRQYELDSLQGVAEYNTAKLQFKRDSEAVATEFSEFVNEEQLARDDRINQYIYADQDLVTKLLGDTVVNEGGRARSRGKNLAREIGRQRAGLITNLNRSNIASKRAVDQARKTGNAKRQELFASVNNPYRPGPAPSQDIEFVKGPSPLGLVAGVAGSVVQGVTTADSLMPEGAGLFD